MTGISDVTRGLALCCASGFAAKASLLAQLRDASVIFRAGVLMPSDLFSTPSLRDDVIYITFAPVAGTQENLAPPLGREWVTTLIVKPSIEVRVEGRQASFMSESDSKVPGIVMLAWKTGDGRSHALRHVAHENESMTQVAQALAMQGDGLEASGNVLHVPSGALSGGIGGYGRSTCLLRRQCQRFTMSIWTTRSKNRELLGIIARHHLLPRDWLDLPDGRKAQILIEGEEDQDAMQTQSLYRRDLRLRVFWDDYDELWSPQMLAGGGWVLSEGSRSSFGHEPDGLHDDIPFEALREIAMRQDMPVAYQGWCLDAAGTVFPSYAS
ncbi:hypothetical protein [Asaia krungthepensis]|uniref:Uncharacterized protein n=1 Tax=Asaia krungthepensis NRIC 0535 TaxID=1307925 RepID=A0ABQ0Q2J6_9PROT|nr:hypothetical protein [Asaia krungthepensis]GBQ88305.1 hypothetical protein AA0535_1509 [Asaia krungthepensis NRIC 0535]